MFSASPHGRFEESSTIDQDDSYGNYRPAFLIKKHKVTGRTEEIMKLQRMQSLDKHHSLLGPVQPDLTGEKPQHRRMFLDSDTNKQVNHISHDVPDGKSFRTDGSPIPHYFRKALDEYTHDLESPDNKISDPSAARQQVAMDKPNIGTEISTKGKVSTDYIKSLIDNKNLG